jgi:uncharacterized lipoprotein YmbA
MRRRIFLSGAGLTLAGCVRTAMVNAYRLAPLPGAVRPGGPASIGVRSVGIPGYLDQNGIVRAAGAYQFNTYENEIWAEPLAGMLQAVMVQDLAQILPASTVLASGGAIDSPVQVDIEINVQKFDPDQAGQMVLLAQVAVKDGQSHAGLGTRTLSLTCPVGLGVTGTVAAMSALWGQAAGQIAAMLV